MSTSFYSSSGPRVAAVLAVWLLAAQALGAPRQAGGPPDWDDPRLDTVLTLPQARPVPAALVFSQLANEAKLHLVAVTDALKEPITLPPEQPTARTVLRHLEKVLEGRWQRQGELFVLGPPAGYEQFARMTYPELRSSGRPYWRKLIQTLRPAEWKRLRTRKPIDYQDLRPALQPTVLHLARLHYWINRNQSEPLQRVKLEWVENQQVQLEFPLVADGSGAELLVVGISPVAGQPARSWERFRLQ